MKIDQRKLVVRDISTVSGIRKGSHTFRYQRGMSVARNETTEYDGINVPQQLEGHYISIFIQNN